MGELLKIESGTRSFEANGKTYYIETSMSIDRWRDYQKMEVELSFGQSFKEIREGLKEIYTALNAKDRLADAAVLTKNLLAGVATIDENRTPTVLKMCALFINTKDEDRTCIDQRRIDEKVEDWSRAGIDHASFFHLALGSIPGFLSAYKESSHDGSPSQSPGQQSEKTPS
jgi:hypothetical protein